MTDFILFITFCIAVMVLARKVASRYKDNSTKRQPAPTKSVAVGYGDSIEEIISRHSDDDSLSVTLTAAPGSELGKRELLRLRPGTPLWLEHCDICDIERVKVYSGGYMIGELLLSEAQEVIDLLQHTTITGTYVASQNSSDLAHIDLRIVIFYTPAEVPATEQESSLQAVGRAMASPYKVTVSTLDNPTLFQN